VNVPRTSSVLAAVLVVLIIVAGVVGYFAGSAVIPPPKTVTVTSTAGTPITITQTVTKTITEKITVTVTPTPTPTPAFPLPHWPKSLVIRAGAIGSTITVLMTVIGSVIEKELGITVRVEPGSALPNMLAMANGEVDLTQSPGVWLAVIVDPEKAKVIIGETVNASRVKILANKILPYYFIMVYTRPDSPINSIDDIAKIIKEGKFLRIGVGGAKGSIDELVTKLILEFYGLSADELVAKGMLSFTSEADVVTKIIEGKLDVVFEGTMPGAAAYRELEVRMPDVKLLPLVGAVRDRLLEFFAGTLEECLLPIGLFKFITTEYPTVSTRQLIMVRDDLPEDLIYYIAKVIDKNKDYIKGSIAAFEFDPNEVWKPYGDVELHPGAAKYYKEMGYMK